MWFNKSVKGTAYNRLRHSLIGEKDLMDATHEQLRFTGA